MGLSVGGRGGDREVGCKGRSKGTSSYGALTLHHRSLGSLGQSVA